MKVGIHFVHFALIKVTDMKPRVNIKPQKAPFLTNLPTIQIEEWFNEKFVHDHVCAVLLQ